MKQAVAANQTLVRKVFEMERVLSESFKNNVSGIGADDGQALERLAQYFLRAPISLQKMSWNAQTKTVLYRSSRSWRTKRNFELFSGPDFIPL